jgi:hypothetical protein
VTEDIRIAPVHPQVLDTIWEDVAAWLEPAIKTADGKFSIEDIKDEILSHTLVLWMVWENGKPSAFYTTRIIEYPQRKALALDWLGGTGIRRWMDAVLDNVEEHARNNNCLHLEGYGRMAWGRLLKRRGWEPEYVAYRMELGNGQG